MSAGDKARSLTRWGAVGVMAAAVLIATGGGFAQSYAGLYHWALEHGLTGWKAQSFPLMVDLFIIVGELGLFLLALDAFVLHRRQMMSWLDFFLPMLIAMAGWTASLIFNVGHVSSREFSYQVTAAVPPIVSMLGLFVLLRTLHRYVQESAEREPAPPAEPQRAIASGTLRQIALMPPVGVAQLPRPRAGAALGAAAAETGAADLASSKGRHAMNGSTATAEKAATAPAPAAPAEVEGEELRQLMMTALGRHNGDVLAACADMVGDGHVVYEEDMRKARERWFTYAVYRLLARHGGDGDLAGQELDERGVEYDPAVLKDLVNSWRG